MSTVNIDSKGFGKIYKAVMRNPNLPLHTGRDTERYGVMSFTCSGCAEEDNVLLIWDEGKSFQFLELG